MKLPSKTASSPARSDKFPPPLMSFLKSNAASKSSARSRSSPMFLKKKTSPVQTQEPSSPKVTCMGQVRTRNTSAPDDAPTTHKCHWIPAAFFSRHFPAKTRRRGWPSSFKLGFRRKSETHRDDSAHNETVVAVGTANSEQDEEENELGTGFVPFVYSPPKNALILTRSRSAPYPSSSLAGRFYGSPLVADDRAAAAAAEHKTELAKAEIQQPESPADSVSDRKIKLSEEEIRLYKQVEESIRESIRKMEATEKAETGKQEQEVEASASSRPPVLTRSKSVPARTAEKLSPGSNSRKIGKF